ERLVIGRAPLGGDLFGWRVGPGGEWEQIWNLRVHSGHRAPFFHPDGQRVCHCAYTGDPHSSLVARTSIVCRQPDTGRYLEAIPYHAYTGGRPDFSPDGRLIASYWAEEITICAVNGEPRKPVRIQNATRHRFTSIAFHPSG